jgi:hypothetical protein
MGTDLNEEIAKYNKALEYYDIDKDFMKSRGWGIAIDKVYDDIIELLERITYMIDESLSSVVKNIV